MDRTRGRPALIALALTLAACGSDDATGPLFEPANITGGWSYVANDLIGTFLASPVECDYTLDMFLPGTSATFLGTYENAQLLCDLNGQTQLVDFGQGTVVGGTLSGNRISFNLDAETVRNTGTVDGNWMGGQVDVDLVIQMDARIDTILVTGGWSATR
ncbi:MAG: hypothetical protein MJB57_02925 [Gemmatimonadetes bacterium]|nr:hypothetical protein [Gemmatimonadota bacterium]